MKFGMRKPNIKKSLRARTTGKLKRSIKSAINPLYGKKVMGYVRNPEKAIKDKIYHKVTFGVIDIFNWVKPRNKKSNKFKTFSKKTTEKTITIGDVDRMNNIEKTKLYHAISVQYQDFYSEYYKNIQKASEYYSLFINNNLDIRYFEKMLDCCNYVFENVEQYRNLEIMNNKLTGATDITSSNSAYVVLAKAYEKLEQYENAIEICEKAIEKGFVSDGTKTGFAGRIKKIKNKIN